MIHRLNRLPKMTIVRTLAILLLAIVVNGVGPRTASAGDVITVTLRSGRQFTAEVHAKTSPQKLWLRFGDVGTSLLRPIAWDQVRHASCQGEKMSVEQLRARVLVVTAQPAPAPTPQSLISRSDEQ